MSDAVRGGMLGTWAVSCCRRGGMVVHPPVWADLGSVFVLRKLISPLHTIWLKYTLPAATFAHYHPQSNFFIESCCS